MDILTIPLFPLNTVLMPRFPLALHIFEERYREMIAACLETGSPFGVSLIREGEEVGEPATPYEIGTLAAITEIEQFEDGRYNLIAIGTRRFRCVEILPADPYISARVELVPDEEEPTDDAIRAALTEMAVEYVRILTGTPDAVPENSLPAEAGALSWVLSFLLQIPVSEKQALLEMDSAAARLDRLKALYERELTVLHVVADLPGSGLVRPVDAIRSQRNASQN